jgi:predicted nucleic acid-binding protein
VTPPLRVLLDVNVWVANLLASAKGWQGTAVQKIVSMVASGRWAGGTREVQLVISYEMLETLEIVLNRLGAPAEGVESYIEAIVGIMKFGPEELDPYLVLGGSEQFAIADTEDARLLAIAFASKTALLVTDNLKDFSTKSAHRVDTRITKASLASRQLYALRHRRSGVDLVVAHPLDVASWLEQRIEFDPEELWQRLMQEAAGKA